MKNKVSNILKLSLVLVVLFGILNIPTTTKQRIDFETYRLKIPFYIKLTEFVNRDYHYKTLVRRITAECSDDYQKVVSLFEWTYRNIKTDIPADWPIVDDHIWHVMIRGYGTSTQLSDVFTTLCVYTGLEAKIVDIWYDPEKKLVLSVVKLEGQWLIFDPHYKIYFTTHSGRVATIKDVSTDPSLIESRAGSILHHGVKYSKYIKKLSSIDIDKLRKPRAYKQNFFKRIYYEAKEALLGRT